MKLVEHAKGKDRKGLEKCDGLIRKRGRRGRITEKRRCGKVFMSYYSFASPQVRSKHVSDTKINKKTAAL